MSVETLLATLGIDSATVSVSASGRYALIQRDPEPDETGLSPDTGVGITLVDLEGDPTDPAIVIPDFEIYIEGVLALTYAGGAPAWSGPWNGTVSNHGVASPYAFWRIDAEQVGGPLFTSEQTVNVQFDLHTAGGWGHGPWGHFPWGHPPVGPVAETFLYEFVIADIAPPTLVAAEAVGPTTIRVTFDDDMTESTVTDPSNWSVARHNEDPEPGVNLVVESAQASADPLSVTTEWEYADAAARLAATGFTDEDVYKLAYQISDGTYWMLADTAPTWREVEPVTQWDLTTDWEHTPGCRYEITASSVEDDAGNLIDTSWDTVFFGGYDPSVPAGRAFSHWRHMVPAKNRIEDDTRDLERFSNCIEEVVGWLLYQVDHFTDQFDPDRATDEQITGMLYDMGNPFSEWDDLELNANQRRKLLRILIDIYSSKGTAWGIEQTIFFLLGEIVRVVEYAAGGWVLGEDALGASDIAAVTSRSWETWDFTAIGAPWELDVEVDGAPITVTFEAGDFADPTLATAEEVAAVIDGATGVGAQRVYPGQPAATVGAAPEPFAVNPGDTLDVDVCGTVSTVTFRVGDIDNPGFATAAEVAARISADLDGANAFDDGGFVAIETVVLGTLATLQVQAGAVQVALGLGVGAETGTDHGQIEVYSETADENGLIQITGGSANALLDFDPDESGGVGGSILAPSDSYTLYSFDIETENVLSSAQKGIVRKVAEFMKPAHTHLINVRVALPLPWPDGWMLGVDELDETTELAE